MHLDTVFTMCDRDICTVFPGVVDEIATYTARRGDKEGEIDFRAENRPFLEVAAEALGLKELRAITTGGDVYQVEREQWDDGNNVVAIEPGVVVAYERNTFTNTKLRKAGHRGDHDQGLGARARARRRPLHDLPDPARAARLSRDSEGGSATMGFNLRNRSLLTVQDYTQQEFKYLLDLARDLKRAKYARTEQEHLEGQGDLPDLREDLDPHALRLRGRLPRPGRARDLSRPVGLADGPQGIGQGHRARARPHVRRDRVSRRRPGGRRAAGQVRGRAGLQRAHRRVSPDPDAGRRDDHARAQRQADLADQLRLCRRHPQQHGPFAHDRRLPDGHGRAPVRAEAAVAGGRVHRHRPRAREEVRRQADHHRRPAGRRSRASTSSTPTSGSRWASPRRSGRSGSIS